MEKTLLTKTNLYIYKVKGEKEGKKYNFYAYEMELPNGTKVNMLVSQKNTDITKIALYKHLGIIDTTE